VGLENLVGNGEEEIPSLPPTIHGKQITLVVVEQARVAAVLEFQRGNQGNPQ